MEPIAIIGIGCRFPGADNPESFWQLLSSGEEAIAPVPKERWDIDAFYDPDPNARGKMNARRGGFLKQVDRFDADFFRISADEVEHTDPQQRLFLEVAWEALEDAAIAPTSLASSQTGVFIGLCTADYHRLLYKDFSCIGPYSGTGTTFCVTANRLSHWLDLRGPSMAVDTACSSSLVTVHLACQSLRSRETDLCIAGGVNLILSPDSTISSSQTGMLSAKSDRCKTFDASADGYVRGEGCGAIVLKRLDDAIKDGDNILALIRGSAVNHNGLSNSLSAPNGLAQQATIRQALANGNVHPSEIGYVDAHAVGTSIGDAIEIRALTTVLAERQADDLCWIGSVKPNIGHLEAAAGISALIKVVLSLQHEEIPPHLHLEQLNPYISLKNAPFSIPIESQKWIRADKRRLAGVSAFGFGGTNAHIVLEEAPEANRKTGSRGDGETGERPLHLLALSAKSEAALLELAQRYETFLEKQPEVSLADVCFTANTGRTHFNHRLSIVTESIAQLRQQLQNFIAHKQAGFFQGQVKGRKRPKIAFLFPGQGLRFGMGEQLYQTQPVFREAIDCCAKILEPYLEKPLLKVLYPELIGLDNSSVLSDKAVLFAVEYALAQLWQSWGIKPQAVMGYGVGECVAAAIAGVFTLEDALRLVVKGSLTPGSLEDAVEAFALVTYSQPQIPIFSLTEELAEQEAATEYWCRLQNGEYSHKADLKNYQTILTMGSKPFIQAESLCLASLHQERDWQELLYSLGELYVRGVSIDWLGFDRDYSRTRLQLPTYPFQRQPYWFKSPENGHSTKLAQLLETGKFSEAQLKLLPQLLEVFAQD